MKQGLMASMIVFFLSGCVSVRPPVEVQLGNYEPFVIRSKVLADMTHWHISGAAAILQVRNSQSANYEWQQTGDKYQIQLAGALNFGSTTIEGGPGFIHVSQANGQHWQGKSPNAVIAKNLGWQLPVEQLVYWVRGIPAPASYLNFKTDSEGHLESLNQWGWEITWSGYTRVKGVDLPGWIVLQRPGFKIKLLIRQWTLP